MILLGKNPGIVTKHSNVESPTLPNEEFLLSTTLKKIQLGGMGAPLTENQETDAETELLDGNSNIAISSGSTDISRDSEKDGLSYIAGYLAKKHHDKYPYLGEYTYKASFHSYSLPSWVQNLSFGGLTEPSAKWLQQVDAMNNYFEELHKDIFSQKIKIVEETTDYIAEKLRDIPRELVRSFCKQRVFIRIKFLNLQLQAKKFKKRTSTTGTDNQRKTIKKIKKIVN
jgi:hypothetical protein